MQETLTRLLALQQHNSAGHSGSSGILGGGPHVGSQLSSSETNRFRQVKLEFPKFSSGDPSSWITTAERYFHFYNIPDTERVLLASIYFGDPVACWFNGSFDDGCFPTWNVFCVALQYRFGPSEFEDQAGALVKLQQTGSVGEYQSFFERLASKVPGVSIPMLRSIFISGLKPKIHRLVLRHRPHDFHEAFALARVYEDQFSEERSQKPWFNLPKPSTATLTPTDPKITTIPTKTSQPISITNLPIRRLSPEEMQVKRDKNLCYNCDERYVFGHKCKGHSTLLYLEGMEEEPDPPDDTVAVTYIPEVVVTPEISLNALFGTSSTRSFRLQGLIDGHVTHILVDGGSTHNFITPHMARFLNLFLLCNPPFKVQVGNGDYLICSAKCSKTPIWIQDHLFLVDLFVLELKGADIVLGVQWLATLGPVVTDYQALTMSFTHQAATITLQGDNPFQANPISTAQLHKLITQDSITACLMCFQPENHLYSPPPETIYATETRTLLSQFSEVFTEPSTLPPDRSHNHHIVLEPDTKPIQVRSYRYPHYQKNEFEKLVKEMLLTRVIRSSHSAFSSPVLLVKKKDDTWRFCMDYRAFNAVTVKDKFPIPTIDELLDELHGAVIVSKLDLRSGYHQIRMATADIHKTAFQTHHGHYEFLVMPFGLSNASSTFQATINEEHIQHLVVVLTTLQKHSLYAKLSKCLFFQHTIQFLGHLISGQGVSPDPQKLQAIADCPPPKSVTQVRTFLGLSRYYRRFIKNYAQIASPLTDLLTKDGFHWSVYATTSFQELKNKLT
ncbi:uncharacterized protein LOC133317324 [Gastrolobium bilobum]|uniref:uncharacterized protein LOC133317324 n=1 Tax=Gastrolobium bilobum TaxID=150636 RepID=UPI002AB2272A|nr:uncharacterized protein LOC133317324 [Gastrolobium bilobum]